MKRTLLIVLLFLFYNSSSAQRIHFTDSTNTWTYRTYYYRIGGVTGYDLFYPQYTGDSSISGNRYLKDGFGNFFREDSFAKRVYVRRPSPDTAEQILFDYNLQIGDTAHYPRLSWVDGLDSVKISGLWYKVWHYTGATFQYHIIEGIGCTNGILDVFNPIEPTQVYGVTQLICFSNNGIQPALSASVLALGHGYDHSTSNNIDFNNTTSCLLSVADDALKSQNIAVVPNPISDNSRIVFPHAIHSGYVTVYNAVGQKVFEIPIKGSNEISIGDKVTMPGMYWYRVTTEGGVECTGKFVR